MKSILLFAIMLLCSFFFSQEENTTFKFSATAKEMKEVVPTFDVPVSKINEDGKAHVVNNKLRRNKFLNSEHALPKGGDPLLINQKYLHSKRTPIANWNGLTESQSGGASPPDPSGAIGPNHYVQMVNTAYQVFDRSGIAITQPAMLGTLLGGVNSGDPIVMYDKFADRWFLSQFKGFPQSEVIVAISQTPDPTGAYYVYEFDLNSFPDYPKYSIWSDGYYITSNKSGESAFVLERDKMLVGDPTAQIIGFNVPSISTSGFFSIMPAMASSTLPPVGTPNYLFYFQDDAWNGGTDHLKIWEIDVDWATTSNSTISQPQSLTVSPFDSEFNSNWTDITQPNTTAKIDAVPGALMYMAHYRSFGTHNSIVLNHTVDVNGANLAGIRWYELRKSGSNPWTLYQEGTFNPDTENRWMGSIAMDYQGNIGLAYSVSGATTFPSIRYTGRYANDPLGQMTITEETLANGTGIENGVRFGDYAQMTIDPIDDATFWYTGEYITTQWQTKIGAFKLANDSDNDVGISLVSSPLDGALTAAEIITVEIKNYGLNDQSNFPVSYQVNNGAIITETYLGTLQAGNNDFYSFTSNTDLSTLGTYSIKAFTGLTTDEFVFNDTLIYNVTHIGNDDIGITSITAPLSSNTLVNSEVITVNVKNFGVLSQSNFNVNYQIDNNAVVSETYSGSLASGASASFSFSTTGDFGNIDSYNIKAFTSLSGDSDLGNDTISKTIIHDFCLPSSDCSFGDGLVKFELNTINNNSTCSNNGYGDFTYLTTDLEQGVSYDLILQSGYDNQFVTVWIDFNDNFEFESSERVVINNPLALTVITIPLLIDQNAALGEHLMRIRTNYNADIDDPCIAVDYGEAEDYTINITSSSVSLIGELYKTINLLVYTKGNNSFEFGLTNIDEEVNFSLFNSIGQELQTATFNSKNNYSLNLQSFAKGNYLVKISNKKFSKVQMIWVK